MFWSFITHININNYKRLIIKILFTAAILNINLIKTCFYNKVPLLIAFTFTNNDK